MINNKNKIIAAIGLALSGLSFAGSMGPVCSPINSTVPCPMNAWDIGVEALYLKPVYNAAGAYINNAVGTHDYSEISNKWGWGFRLDGSYHFNTGNDASLDWMHYDNTSHFIPYNVYNANRFDRANMVLGQHVDFSQAKSARFYGGLQYTSIQVNQTANNIAVPTQFGVAGFNALLQNNNSDFKGVGPIVGIDFAYALGTSGFSITANTATSLLYGSSRANVANMEDNVALVHTSIYASKKSMISGIEEKLGLNYKHQFSQGQLTLNGGYQALNYFNPLTRVATAGIVNSDFGLYGPYLGVHWLGLASFS